MHYSRRINEKCAVFGANLITNEAVGVAYNGLLALQHRGQEGAGIAVAQGNKIFCHKDAGLVSEVFSGDKLGGLPKGNTAVGHTRYSTTGSSVRENAGPFVTEYLTGRIATAHNGNITNASDIRERLVKGGLQFNATSDSEVISSLIAYYIRKEKDNASTGPLNAAKSKPTSPASTCPPAGMAGNRPLPSNRPRLQTALIEGVVKAADSLRGAYSLVIAAFDERLVAVRDPNGFRPLCIGSNETGYAVASESCALDVCGFQFIRDVAPGEVILIENGTIVYQEIRLHHKETERGLCIFEYVYFARPDSVIDGLSVYDARYNMGLALADEYPVEADVVCGVPDSGLEAASGYSAKSGIPLASGFVKNRYIGRSFIYPLQTQRDSAVLQKLNPLAANIRGKKVVLVDDSIVRGTTSQKIVGSLKAAGAKEVHMRISSPPFRYTCHYGTDIDGEENLIANRMGTYEIADSIGADSLGYISVKGLRYACRNCSLTFCTACFTGNSIQAAKKDMFE